MKTTSRVIDGMRKARLSYVLFLSLCMYSSCSDNENPAPQSMDPLVTEKGTPSGDLASANIGTAGGTVQSEDGKLTVIIPSGALAANTAITMQPITNQGPLGLGSGYRLSPEGLTFTEPVTLKFKYDEQLLDETPEDFLWIITQASDGSWNALTKSIVDTHAKTVTIETTHFSDWALGRFIDLSLSPSSRTILKGQSVDLHVAGFIRDKNLPDDEELVPLIPITSKLDALTPLTTIPPIESRLMDFKVKGWTLNGVSAPVSGSNGKLTASKNTAIYTAPNNKPSPNPVAVSVALESSNKEGSKFTYILTSSITVVENNLYLLVNIDGQEYEYYQYGFNGAIPPDPNNISIANCGAADGSLGIVGSYVQNSINMIHGFGLQIKNPAVGTKSLACYIDDGEDDMSFSFGTGVGYEMSYTQRIKSGDVCESEEICGQVSVTLIDYTGATNSRVAGYFSGTLYEDKTEFGLQCKMPIAHAVEGEFWLTLAN